MAQTLAEADAIEAARLEYGVVIFVGYMRRYAPALERLKEEIKGKEIKYVRVRDIIGRASVLSLWGYWCFLLHSQYRLLSGLPYLRSPFLTLTIYLPVSQQAAICYSPLHPSTSRCIFSCLLLLLHVDLLIIPDIR